MARNRYQNMSKEETDEEKKRRAAAAAKVTVQKPTYRAQDIAPKVVLSKTPVSQNKITTEKPIVLSKTTVKSTPIVKTPASSQITPKTNGRMAGGFSSGRSQTGKSVRGQESQISSIGDLRRSEYAPNAAEQARARARAIDRMTENSIAWHKADDTGKQALFAENEAIRKKYGMTYNDFTGESFQRNQAGLVENLSKPVNAYVKTQENYDKQNPLTVAGHNTMAGLAGASGGLYKTLDFFLPDVVTPKPVQKWIDSAAENADSIKEKVRTYNYDRGGKVGGMVGDLYQSGIEMIPTAVLAYLTAGQSETAQAASAMANVNKGSVAKVIEGIAKSPAAWTSFARTVGSDYEQARQNGASDAQAAVSAIISSGINAGIEIGGGVEALAGREASLKNLLRSAGEEGMEEVKQGVVSALTQKGVYDKDAPYYSTTDDSAVINPVRMMQEYGSGALLGGVIGAGKAIGNKGFGGNVQEVQQQNAVQTTLEPSQVTPTETVASQAARAINTEAQNPIMQDVVRQNAESQALGQNTEANKVALAQQFAQLENDLRDAKTMLPGTLRDNRVANITNQLDTVWREMTGQNQQGDATPTVTQVAATPEKQAAIDSIRSIVPAQDSIIYTPRAEIQNGDVVFVDDRGNYGVVVGQTQNGDFNVRFINNETKATATKTIQGDLVQRVMGADEYRRATPEEVDAAAEDALGYNEERMNRALQVIEQAWDRVTVPYSPVVQLREQMSDAANIAERSSAKKQPRNASNRASLTNVDGEQTEQWARVAFDIYNANQAQRIFLKNLRREWHLTETDLIDAGEIAAGRSMTRGTFAVKQDKLDQINAYAEALRTYNGNMEEAFSMQRKIKAKRIKNTKDITKYSDEWTDSNPLRSAISTPERVFQHICGSDAAEMIESYITPVHWHEAESVRWQKAFRDRLREVTDGITKEESIYCHMLNRLREAQGDSTLHKDCADYLEANQNKINVSRVEQLEKDLVKLTSEMFPDISAAQVTNGDNPLEFRANYIPSNQVINEGNAFNKMLRAMGIETKADELPTEISGKTEDYRPGKKYGAFRSERTGINLEFDAVKAMDAYISNAAHAIYHTGDVQNLRILEEQLRLKAAEPKTKAEYLAAKNNPTFTMDAKSQIVSEFFKMNMGNLPHFPTWIGEYTNLLAGKKARADRVVEDFVTGRSVYRTVGDIESKVAGNMVGFNVNSALTNFIPLTQGGAELRKSSMMRAALEYSQDKTHGDVTYQDKSDFLTNRVGAGRVYETTMDKVKDVGFIPMAIADDFSSNVLHRARVMDNMEQKGMTENAAIMEADRWTAGVMADRSLGAMPNAFSVKNPIVRLFSMFQLEVANQYGYMFEDVPRNQKEKGMAAVAGVLLQIALGAFLFNDAKEKVTGSRSATDPIDIINNFVGDLSGYKLPNTFDLIGEMFKGDLGAEDFQTEKQGIYKAMANAGTEIGGEIPFVGGVAFGGGRIPVSSAIPNPATMIGAAAKAADGTYSGEKASSVIGKELLKPFYYLVPPTGGGQIKKTVEGIATVRAGGSYAPGKDGASVLQFPVYNQKPQDYAKAALFGKWSSAEAQDYVDSGFKGLSAAQTEVYNTLRDRYNADSKTVMDTIKALSGVESEKDADGNVLKSAKTIKQEMLFDMEGLTISQKREIDRKLISGGDTPKPASYNDRDSFMISVYVPESRKDAAREAINAGLTIDQFVDFNDMLRDAKKQDDISDSAARMQVLQNIRDDAQLTGEQMSALADKVLISDLGDSRREDWEDVYKGKISAGQYLEIAGKYSEIKAKYDDIDGIDSKAQREATDFGKWVDTLPVDQDIKETVKDDFSFYNMFPADAKPYRWDMLTSEDAKEVAPKLEASGMKIDTYNDIRDACSEFKADKDANGKTISGSKKTKVVNYIRGRDDLTPEQQNLMIQSYGYKVSSGSKKTSSSSTTFKSLPTFKKLKGF